MNYCEALIAHYDPDDPSMPSLEALESGFALPPARPCGEPATIKHKGNGGANRAGRISDDRLR